MMWAGSSGTDEIGDAIAHPELITKMTSSGPQNHLAPGLPSGGLKMACFKVRAPQGMAGKIRAAGGSA